MHVAVFVAALVAVCAAEETSLYPQGWRMKDRFAGLRFECRPSAADSFAESVRDKAEQLAGFGWSQPASYLPGVVGGEFRGTPTTASSMSSWLKTHNCAVKTSPDTKIRFHFSHFKLMEGSRRMCFEEAPFACAGAPGGHTEL